MTGEDVYSLLQQWRCRALIVHGENSRELARLSDKYSLDHSQLRGFCKNLEETFRFWYSIPPREFEAELRGYLSNP